MIKLNNYEIKPTIFPDGTSQVWNLHPKALAQIEMIIDWHFEEEAEVMHMAQLMTLIKAGGCHKTTLNLRYLPYARQDKAIENGRTFALHTFAKILNSMGFDKINCIDPHSLAAQNLIKMFYPIYPTQRVNHIKQVTNVDRFAYPDDGARQKYNKLFMMPFVTGHKVRDEASGEIKEYTLLGTAKDAKILVVDDICDGGATFIMLAKALKQAGVKEMYLYITHGLFTKGIECLFEAGYKKVFTYENEFTSKMAGKDEEKKEVTKSKKATASKNKPLREKNEKLGEEITAAAGNVRQDLEPDGAGLSDNGQDSNEINQI